MNAQIGQACTSEYGEARNFELRNGRETFFSKYPIAKQSTSSD